MQQFVVSARKYRPVDFEEVVGQKSITQTLNNAIASNHLAQALLFTGPRGVGKTTCARILAKKINASEATRPDEDFSFNIFELDAASNNSVDDIRNLIDQVRIPPQTGKYKVYIIDEVHMLSQSAFNAFLKTLEEPPAHAIFILATTEKHKILPTILSRCQIFDFKRITITDIKEHLQKIAQNEGIEADPDALQIIAQKADGALRDALSTFDRVVTFCGNNLSRQAVAENLSVLDYEAYFQTLQFLQQGDIKNLMLHYNQIMADGFEGLHFLTGLASHIRDLMVSKHPETLALLSVGEQLKQRYAEQTKNLNGGYLIEALDLINQATVQYKQSNHQRLLVELLLMKLAVPFLAESEKKKPELSPPDKTSSSEKSEKSDSKLLENNKYQSGSKIAETAESKETYAEEKNLSSNEPTESASHQEEHPQNGLNKRVSALSIKSLKVKKEHQPVAETQQKELPKETFDEEKLQAAWIETAEIFKNNGLHNLHSILSCSLPKLQGEKILITFFNHSMRTDFRFHKGEIKALLAEKLHNHFLDFDLRVDESKKPAKAYTDKEKLERLIEKNKAIEVLVKRLDLEV